VNVPQGKRPLERPRLKWEDRIKENVERVRPEIDWKESGVYPRGRFSGPDPPH